MNGDQFTIARRRPAQRPLCATAPAGMAVGPERRAAPAAIPANRASRLWISLWVKLRACGSWGASGGEKRGKSLRYQALLTIYQVTLV
jgi:hypothetical protein